MKNALNFELNDEVIYYLNDTRIHIYITGEGRLGIHTSVGDKDYFYMLDRGKFVEK